MCLCPMGLLDPLKRLKDFFFLQTLFKNICLERVIYWWLHVFLFFKDLQASKILLWFFNEKEKSSKLVRHMWQSNWDSQIDTPGHVPMCETSGCHGEKSVNQLCQFRADGDESLWWFKDALFEAYLHNPFMSPAYIFYRTIIEEGLCHNLGAEHSLWSSLASLFIVTALVVFFTPMVQCKNLKTRIMLPKAIIIRYKQFPEYTRMTFHYNMLYWTNFITNNNTDNNGVLNAYRVFIFVNKSYSCIIIIEL